MNKTTSWILIVIVAILGVFAWYVTKDNGVESTPTPTVSATATGTPTGQQSVSTPQITFTYGGDFGLATTKAQILVTSYIPSCDENFDYCLYYNGAAYKGTNFESAGLRIQKRTDLAAESLCMKTPPSGYTASTTPSASNSSGDYATTTFGSLGDAGAGHYSAGSLYRVFIRSSSTCYEFETRIGETQFANYPAGTIKQFTDSDRANVQAKLAALVNGVTITATGAHPFSI